MLDFELFKFFKVIVDQTLADNGINAEMTQSYQPTSQGVDPEITVFMENINDRRHGFRKVDEIWNAGNNDFDHVETQQMETDFQMGCIAIQDPTKTGQLSAKDILNIVAAGLQSQFTIEALRAQDMGILRITDIRNPKFSNDASDFQASPSFDFTVTHKTVTIKTRPKAEFVEHNLYPI